MTSSFLRIGGHASLSALRHLMNYSSSEVGFGDILSNILGSKNIHRSTPRCACKGLRHLLTTAVVLSCVTAHAQVLERDPQSGFSVSRPAAWMRQPPPTPQSV